MADLQSINSLNSYQGNANLGGGTLGVGHIDLQPVQALAAYTVEYNKAEYNQRAKDTENRIKELSDITAFDPANALPKDREEALKAYNQLQEYATEYARKAPANNADRIQNLIEYRQKVARTKSLLSSANSRAISYQKRKNDIASESSSAAEKELKYKLLDDEINNSDIFTPISAEEKFDLSVPKVGSTISTKVNVASYDGNKWVENELTLFDPSANINASFLDAQGMGELMLSESSPEWEKLSDRQKTELQLKRIKNKNSFVWSESSKVFNSALADPKYKKADGGIDLEAIKSDNPIVGNTLGLIEHWNEYARRMKEAGAKGFLASKTGEQIKIHTPIDTSKYVEINPSKPLSPEQLIFLQRFANAAAESNDVKMQYTGEANTRQNTLLDYQIQKMNAETSRRNSDRLATGGGTGGSDVINDVYEGINSKVQADVDNLKGKYTNVWTRVNALDLDAQSVVLDFAKKGTGINDLGNGDISLHKNSAGEIEIRFAPTYLDEEKRGLTIGVLPKKGVNLKVQPDAKSKKRVIAEANKSGTAAGANISELRNKYKY